MGNEQSTPNAKGSGNLFSPALRKKSVSRKSGKKARRASSTAPTVSTRTRSPGEASVYEPQKVAIIGGGPVGALAALYFAKAGWQVTIYELRGDLRNPENRSLNFTKSINLALSERGINGIRSVDPDLLEGLLEDTIPMHGRMIHDKKGKQSSQKYDVHGRYIRAIDRSKLNETLLDELEKMNNVELKFYHNLRQLSLEKNEAIFERKFSNGDYDTTRVYADLFIGADGAHSQVRRQMMKYVRLNYQQEYIDSLWCELQIPPDAKGNFKLSEHHLHIWPRQTFMFIAIPSLDKTFTCTLFMPEDMFKQINNEESLLKFFYEEFPDVVPLIGEDKLVADYLKNSKLPLISLKCTPYHYRDKCVLLGDSSHAMVPFYGQGMNCGFEDVRILWEHICEKPTMAAALEAYTAERHPDCSTINDLAMNNYVEMRASVASYRYLFKKNLEEFLYNWLPFLGIRTQYSMVSFSNIRYSEVMRRVKRQDKILNTFGTALVFGGLGVTGWLVWRQREMLMPGWDVLKEWRERLMKGEVDFNFGLRKIVERVSEAVGTSASSLSSSASASTISSSASSAAATMTTPPVTSTLAVPSAEETKGFFGKLFG